MKAPEKLYYTRVIVHGVISADDPRDAVAKLAEMIQQGIGENPKDGKRPGKVSVGAGVASLEENRAEIIVTNNEFVMRIGTGRGLDE